MILGCVSQDSILLSRVNHKLPWEVKGNENMKAMERIISNETLLKLEEMK